MVFEINHYEKVSPLFKNWDESLIWSCLQNIMGHVFVNCVENPTSAVAILGEFCFFAGTPDCEIVTFKPDYYKKNSIIMVPQNNEWGRLIESCYGKRAEKTTRYAIKSEKNVFDRAKLEKVVAGLSQEYKLMLIDEKVFYDCCKTDWCRDFVSQYDNYNFYTRYGLGVVIRNADGEIVSGASSYSGYDKGIEVEICTRKDYRRKGLAYVCGARLVLECLNRNLYPKWDARTKWSVSLAEKLGYHFSHEYTVYEIKDY